MTHADPYHFDSRVVLGMFDTSIEADAQEQIASGYLHSGVIAAYMILIRYDEWVSGRRNGNSDRVVEFAHKYGARFKTTTDDMYFRAEYKMLKGPMPESFQQLIFMCWDFSEIKHPEL